MKNKNLAFNYENVSRFSPDFNFGLNDAQIKERIENNLTNNTRKKNSKSYFKIIMENFCTFFNLLGVLVAIALIISKAEIQQFFFVIIYLSNILVGIVLEIKAKRCIDRLSLITENKVIVIRNGREAEIKSKDIVLDDVLRLGLGSQVPTDCIVISGTIEVNESLITGESVPVKKSAGDFLYSGSFIVSGSCYARAENIGENSYIEKLSAKARVYKKPHSEIMNTLKLIIKSVSIVIIPLAICFILKSIYGHDLHIFEAIKRTVTVVIGMIPSGMFLLTSVALAVGVLRLYKHKTLVQDLFSLEILAKVDTICFDKTGTITDGNMIIEKYIPLDNSVDYNTILSSMLNVLKTENQTESAMREYFTSDSSLEALTVLPFNPNIKLSAVTFKDGLTYSFGAPEFVLNKEEYFPLKSIIEKYAKKAQRVLVFATSNKVIENQLPPKDFRPLGLIVISDSIRENVIATISWFKENNVTVKVISGDNAITVSEISKRVGIDGAEKYISLENLSNEEVIKCANEYTVFGRVSPEQKALLIKSMNNAGHVTAMTGDGINDILALKEANCAISVASGSDAAKNISNLVLTDNNFNSMPKIVYEGRRVINNVQSTASLYFMKTLFTFFLGVFILMVPAFSAYPFELMQMILLEVFVIGPPSFFLSLQSNDKKVSGKFIDSMIKKSLPSAIIMLFNVLVVFLFEFTLKNGYFTPEHWTTIKVITLTFSGFISLFFICKPFNKYRFIVFIIPFSIVLTIILYAVFNGLSLLGLTSFMPLNIYWPLLLIALVVIATSVPLYILIRKINIKIPEKFIKKYK